LYCSLKAKDRTKDQTFKARTKDRTKDSRFKAKARTKDCDFVLKDNPRTKAKDNIPAVNSTGFCDRVRNKVKNLASLGLAAPCHGGP